MQRELTHQDGDVEERSDSAEIAEVTLICSAAEADYVWLEVKRGAVGVADPDGSVSGPERVNDTGRHDGDLSHGKGPPLAANHDLQRSLEHLIFLGQVRMHMRLWGPAVGRELQLHL